MNRILKLGKKVSLVSFFLLISCINNPISPLYKSDNSSVNVDRLYQEFKLKNKKEYQEKMRNKKPDNFENINVSINTGLQKVDYPQ